MKDMIFIESRFTDPRFNLALEQYVFDEMPRDHNYFMLWQNHNTIVVGKHQNTAEEINQEYVREHGITVVRRLSGGGAVYHDMGNVNYTFIADADHMEQLNLQAFCVPVVDTLKTVGVEAEISGRNDITIDGKKFSGNSQYIKEGRIMHHGTLMFDSNLNVVSEALRVNSDKYVSKGFKSVKSRVTNIRPYLKHDMEMEEFKQILKQNMVQGRNMTEYQLTNEDIIRVRDIEKSRYDRWEWNYGESPDYSVQKERKIEGCGRVKVYMDVDNGCIDDIRVFGDFFGDGATKELKERLHHCRLEESQLRLRLQCYNMDKSFKNMKQEEFVQLLVS